MKISVAIFVLSTLALTSASSIARRDASEVKQARDEFLSLFEWNKIADTVVEYLYRDAEVQDFVKYLGSEEFKDIVKQLTSTNEYDMVLEYLEKAGLNAVKVHNVAHALLGLTTLPVNVTEPAIQGGVMGMLKDLVGGVNKEALVNWFMEWKSSELFQALIKLPSQPFIQTLAPKLKESPEVQALVAKLDLLGVSLSKLNE